MTAAVDIAAIAKRLSPKMVQALEAAERGDLRRYRYGVVGLVAYIAGEREATRTAVALARRDLVTIPEQTAASMDIPATDLGRAVLDHLTAEVKS